MATYTIDDIFKYSQVVKESGKDLTKYVIPYLSTQPFDWKQEREKYIEKNTDDIGADEAKLEAEELYPEVLKGKESQGFYKAYVLDWAEPYPGSGLWDWVTPEAAKKSGVSESDISIAADRNAEAKKLSMERRGNILYLGWDNDFYPSCVCSIILLKEPWHKVSEVLGCKKFFVFPKYRRILFVCTENNIEKAKSDVAKAAEEFHDEEPFTEAVFQYDGQNLLRIE